MAIGYACRCGGTRVDGKCDRCGIKPGRHETTTARRGYDHRWRRLSERYRANHPLCEECERHGVTTPATEVHHVVPVKQAGELRLQQANLLAVCRRCHEELEGLAGRSTPPYRFSTD